MPDGELEEFKRQIDLREYAARVGFELDRRESSRCTSVMRLAREKIIIKRNPNGHYVYFSVHDDRDNGTIIDFVKNHKRMSLGEIRKELRPWIGQPARPMPEFSKLMPAPKDRLRVERDYHHSALASRHPYLERERGLSPALFTSPRFAGRVRRDAVNNAVFPHYDRQGLCGFERKNKSFTGFAKGGEKGLWESHDLNGDNTIVFCESAIDALSHAALFPNEHARYRSIGGSLNDKQPLLICDAIKAMPEGSAIIAAMDNDEAGRLLALLVEDCFHKVERPDLAFIADLPVSGKDWNDALLKTGPSRNPPSPSFPIARPELR